MVYVFNPYSLNLKSISSQFISPRSCVPNKSSKRFDDIAEVDLHMSAGLLSKTKSKKSKAKRFSSFFSFDLVRIQALQITFCCKNVHTAYKFNIQNSVLSASPLTRPKLQIENVQLSLLFLLVPLSFATYFPFGQIIAAMSLITLGLRLVNLKGSLDKHLYTYTKGIFLLSFMTALAVDLLMPVKTNGSNC